MGLDCPYIRVKHGLDGSFFDELQTCAYHGCVARPRRTFEIRSMTPGIDRTRLSALAKAENAAFAARTPKSAAMRKRAGASLPNAVPMQWMTALYRTPAIYVAEGKGSCFTDIDGNKYCDFNVCDLSMTMGYGPRPATFRHPGAIRMPVSAALEDT